MKNGSEECIAIDSNTDLRLDYIDLFRATGIILMIMGHIGYGAVFDKFIHAFHMPMFFFVSGYFFKIKNGAFLFFVKKKERTLLIPFFVFGFIHLIIYSIKEISFEIQWLNFFIFPTKGFPISGAIWFLTTLFITEIMYALLEISLSNYKIRTISIIALTTIGMIMGKTLSFPLPWGFDVALGQLLMFHIGYTIRITEKRNKYVNKILNLRGRMLMLLALFSFALVFVNGYVNIRITEYSNIFLFWLNSIGCTIIFWNFCKCVNRKLSKISGFFFRIKNFFLDIGKNSIVYVCLNQLIILVVNKLPYHSTISLITSKFIDLVLVLLLLGLISNLIMKTKLKILIGR